MRNSDSQSIFIDHVLNSDDFILVEAPAGTGKTYSSILAAEQLILKGKLEKFQKILILTFSRNARAQIIKEINSSPQRNELRRYIHATNYHSFFKKYIDSYRTIIGICVPITITDDEHFLEEYTHFLTRTNKSSNITLTNTNIFEDFIFENNELHKINSE